MQGTQCFLNIKLPQPFISISHKKTKKESIVGKIPVSVLLPEMLLGLNCFMAKGDAVEEMLFPCR